MSAAVVNSRKASMIWAPPSDLQIQTVRPTPLESHLAEDGWIMTFPVGDKGRTSLIRMEIRPEGLGTLEGEIAIEGRQPARLSTFVYP
jgi:hypothetical protein